MQKGRTIHFMRPQGFILGLADGASRVHVNTFEALTPQKLYNSTIKVSSNGYVNIKTRKGMYGLNKLQYWHTTTWLKIFLLMLMYA